MNHRWYKRFRTPPLDQSDYSNLLHHSLIVFTSSEGEHLLIPFICTAYKTALDGQYGLYSQLCYLHNSASAPFEMYRERSYICFCAFFRNCHFHN